MRLRPIRIALFAAAALWSAGLAYAQTGAVDPYRAHPLVPSDTEHPALTEFSMQQRAAIYAAVMKQPATPLPFDTRVEVGTKLPPSAELQPLPDDIRAHISAASKYEFAVWRDQVLLVDPAEKTVADILHGWVLRDYK